MSPDTAASTFDTPVDLNRDVFMRRLIASLGHLNEGILGGEVASGYVMNVGLSMGAAIEAEYKRFWQIDRPLTIDEYAHVIVDLKQRIHGNFSLVSKDAEKVVVRTTSCPFDDFVRQSPSLCFMTSSVFGGIAARNFGWAKVALHRRIALGDDGCYVSVFLERTPEAEAAIGKEYAPDVEQASPDIAEQLRLMDRLRGLHRQLGETASRWDEVVQAAAEAILVVDENRDVTYANDRWRDLVGVEGGELVGSTIWQLVPEDQRSALGLALDGVFEGRRAASVDVELRHRAGGRHDVQVSAGPIRDDLGAISGALLIVHDVHEERETRRLKDHFLSSASHELRSPLTTIVGMVDLLERRVQRHGAVEVEELERRLRMIRSQSDRLITLSNELLDAARIQPGAVVQRSLERFDLRTVVEELVRERQELLPPDGPWRVAAELPPSPLEVDADRQRIHQVVLNLLDNAVKYSPEGSEITIAARRSGSSVEVAVTDEGIGVPLHDRERLFTSFHRASNASSDEFPGVGLGLYVCQGIARQHGGLIRHEQPESGVGSRFVLALPSAAT